MASEPTEPLSQDVPKLPGGLDYEMSGSVLDFDRYQQNNRSKTLPVIPYTLAYSKASLVNSNPLTF